MEPNDLSPRPRRRFRLAIVLTAALGLSALGAVAIAGSPGPSRARHHEKLDPQEARERAEKIADKVIDRLDGSETQQRQLRAILVGKVGEALNLRAEGHALRERAFEALMRAPRPDRAEAEALRVEGLALADRASRLLLDTLFEAQAVLTDAQLVELRDKLSWLYD